MRTITLKKGLNIPLKGEAALVCDKTPTVGTYALMPSDFVGLVPKMLIKEGDTVKAGTPLFCDKKMPQINFCSPVSGKVVAVTRGEKRKLLSVSVASDGQFESINFGKADPKNLSREDIKSKLLQSGLWPLMIQRPFGIIANPDDSPRDIFVSCFNSAPLAGNVDFMLEKDKDAIVVGLQVLSKLTDGKVYLGVKDSSSSFFSQMSGVEVVAFNDIHPAGNVGVQIHNINHIRKGEIVWTVQPQGLAWIGKLFMTGVLDTSMKVALTGPEVEEPQYYNVHLGASLKGWVPFDEGKRTISGNVLSGIKVSENDYLGFYDSQVTVIAEGDNEEFLGWIMPRTDRFSVSRSFFSWLMPKRAFKFNANLNGSHRAFVFSGLYEKVLPMDIYPVVLLKAILAKDIDRMEQLGILEVVPEDMALCEFVCPSKIDVQQILRDGITIMMNE